MYVLTIVFIFILTSKTSAQTFLDYSINVGTVLFSPTDLQNRHWTKDEIGLLKARQIFQSLLPPLNIKDTTNNEYVNTLLRYFKDTYSTIKREATCPIADNLMTTAFSDAIGGYLQLWVLPISKLAFYGGMISQDNIMKLYQFHHEIKRFIDTDGTGWHTLNKSLLNSILTNIAAPKHVTRNIKNPCDKLAYYEKTENGLMIPTPSIDWGDTSSTMFVPLRNHSIISLVSPNYPNSLFLYYDVAKNCLEDSKNDELYKFDDRFQSWLHEDVVPHLSDDTVYLPLGSVLSLMNNSCDMYANKHLGVYYSKDPICPHYKIAGIPIDFSSKKTLIISIILFLEIVWCIPALVCIICSRRKKNRRDVSIYTLLCRNNEEDDDKGDYKCDGEIGEKKKKKGFFLKGTHFSNHKNQGIKLEKKPTSENFKVQAAYFPEDCKSSIATDTNSYIMPRDCSTVGVIHETSRVPRLKSSLTKIIENAPTPPLKSSLKKIQSSHPSSLRQAVTIVPSKSSSKTCCTTKEIESHESFKIKITSQSSGTQTKSSSSSEDANLASCHEIVEPKGGISNTTHVKSSSNIVRKTSSQEFWPMEELTGELNPECPCLACLEAEVGSITTLVTEDPQNCEWSDKSIEINMENLEPTIEKPQTLESFIEIPCTEKPFIEKPQSFKLSIEKPQTFPSIEKPCIKKPQSFKLSIEKPQTFKPAVERPKTFKRSIERPQTFKPSTERPQTFKRCIERPQTFKRSIEEPQTVQTSIETPQPLQQSTDPPPLIPVAKFMGLRLESGHPYLEIKIDKPQAEICVGISGSKPRRSRIPKMLPKGTFAKIVQRTSCTSPMRKNEPLAQRNKSLIPQPKRRPVDDIVIKTSKHKHRRKDSKLNVTL